MKTAAVPELQFHEALMRMFVCGEDLARAIARKSSDRRYQAKAVIIKQGDDPAAAFLVLAGRAQALAYGMEGQLVLLHEFLPGDFFGTLATSVVSPDDADVIAVEAVRAALFVAVDFVSLAEAHGCIAIVLSQSLLRQLRSASLRMRERTTLSAVGRVHAELLRLARLGDGRTIHPAPILSALAVRVQSTRETVSRAINALERRGIIRREAEALIIVAPHRLEELVV